MHKRVHDKRQIMAIIWLNHGRRQLIKERRSQTTAFGIEPLAFFLTSAADESRMTAGQKRCLETELQRPADAPKSLLSAPDDVWLFRQSERRRTGLRSLLSSTVHVLVR